MEEKTQESVLLARDAKERMFVEAVSNGLNTRKCLFLIVQSCLSSQTCGLIDDQVSVRQHV